jgi:hypothetical protein
LSRKVAVSDIAIPDQFRLCSPVSPPSVWYAPAAAQALALLGYQTYPNLRAIVSIDG